jgi:hypothetical protein
VDPVIFVEILDRRGHVAHRVRLETLPATIGRSYRNAVILDDRYVSPEHVRIEQMDDGTLVALDLGSDNGVYDDTRGSRLERVALEPGTRLRVGHTVLRFATADQPVAAAARDPLGGSGWWRYSRRATGLVLAAALVLSMLTSYFTSYDETSAAARLAEALMLGVGLAAWAGSWSLVTRITAHRFAFGQHLAIVAGVLLAAELVNGALRMLDVVEPGTTLAEWTQTMLIMASVAAVLYGHLSLTSTLPSPRRLGWAVGVAVTLVGLAEFAEWADRDSFMGSPRFEGAVHPVGMGADRGVPLDTFIAEAGELQRAVDALAQQPLPH